MPLRPSTGAVALPRSRPSLFTSKVALTHHSLVRFGDVLDSVLKLAIPLGQLLGYHVAATGGGAIRDVSNERDSLTSSKLVLCWWTAFRAHLCGPDTRQGVCTDRLSYRREL